MNLTRREVKGRYTQSLFGIGWAIAQPLATMAVFKLVFSRLGQIPSGGVPYPLFASAALVPWFFFYRSCELFFLLGKIAFCAREPTSNDMKGCTFPITRRDSV